MTLSSGGSELQDSAFGYFITACIVILLAIMSYLILPKMVRPQSTNRTYIFSWFSSFLVLFIHKVFV